MKSGFSDLEDGIQNYCGEEADHKVLITRNTRDCKKSSLAIITLKEFLLDQIQPGFNNMDHASLPFGRPSGTLAVSM